MYICAHLNMTNFNYAKLALMGRYLRKKAFKKLLNN